MTLIRLALRNLARNRRRTGMSMAIVAAGTVGIVLTAGFIAYSFDGLSEALVLGGLGHLEVVDRAAAESGLSGLDRPVTHGLDDWAAIRADVESAPDVVGAAATVHLTGMISAEDRTAAFVGLGVEPDREERLGFETKLRAGEHLPATAPEPGDDRVVLSLGLARTLDVQPGDLVTALVVTPDGMLNAWDLTVSGLYTTGIQDLDGRFARVHLATAQRLLETERVSNLVVLLDDEEHADAVQARLAEDHPETAAIGWKERAPFYDQIRGLYGQIFWFLGSLIAILVALAASNTTMMTVLERFRELGTLRAIGTTRSQVATIVLAEAGWLGFVGALVGNAVAIGLIQLINALRITMPPPPGAVDGIDLRLAVVPEVMAGSVVAMVLILLVSAALPTWRVARLRIVEALGHV